MSENEQITTPTTTHSLVVTGTPTSVPIVLCPTCNAEFHKDEAPWLKQKQYCPVHDRIHFGKCEFCTPEQAEEVRVAQEKAAKDAGNRVE